MSNSLRDINVKISATKKTSQITSAMHMVSASKLRKAEKTYLGYKDYMSKISDLVSDVTSSSKGEFSHPMLNERPIKKTGYLIITSDRGLAGPYNGSIGKTIKKIVQERHKSGDYIVGAIGKKGYDFCKTNKLNIIEQQVVIRDDVQFHDILPLARKLISFYERGEIDKLVVIYNNYVNTITQEVTEMQLLPIQSIDEKANSSYEYEQGMETTLKSLLPMYIENTIYGLILNAKTSEHAARMTAMKSATDNAHDLVSRLQLIYNRARQATITVELTDIIGGASAVE